MNALQALVLDSFKSFGNQHLELRALIVNWLDNGGSLLLSRSILGHLQGGFGLWLAYYLRLSLLGQVCQTEVHLVVIKGAKGETQ